MCGFCGFTGNIYNNPESTIINAMNKRLAHRGPDDDKIYVTPEISLGFRRLAFLGLDESGAQPMTDKDGRYTIVFNGEIYNFRKLAEGLPTSSDTAVLLSLYRKHGSAMLPMLRGMFAFAIYDSSTGEIFAARDYFGIKPFYYAVIDGQLVFASEIKAILEYPGYSREVNPAALSAYLSFQYSVLDETFFKGIFKLPPAHFLRFAKGEAAMERWWQADFSEVDTPLADFVDKIDVVIGDSIAAHQVADVEIGTFLSGGVDSSLIAANPRFEGKKSFTVGFDYEGYNEIEYAKALSEDVGLEHHADLISTEEYWQAFPKIQYHMDEPLADPAAAALYFVSQSASRHVKGVLSGEGADELFGGYNIYQEPLSLRPITVLPRWLRRTLAAVAAKLPSFKGRNFFIRGGMDLEQRFIGNAKIFSEKERAEILINNEKSKENTEITAPYYKQAQEQKLDDITKMQYLDLHLWMVGDILLKADKMTMAHSIEGRVPFLDKEVFAVARTLPTKFRVTKKSTKHAMRLAAARHLKPQWSDKKKLGFPVPIRLWLRQDKYYQIIKSSFQTEAANIFFHTDKLQALLDTHKSGKVDNSRKIWTIYTFLIWHQQFF